MLTLFLAGWFLMNALINLISYKYYIGTDFKIG